jgi:hypothetical protein
VTPTSPTCPGCRGPLEELGSGYGPESYTRLFCAACDQVVPEASLRPLPCSSALPRIPVSSEDRRELEEREAFA